LGSLWFNLFRVSGFSVQVSAFVFLLPDTRNLTPETLRT
jgi:hypothetical protein